MKTDHFMDDASNVTQYQLHMYTDAPRPYTLPVFAGLFKLAFAGCETFVVVRR